MKSEDFEFLKKLQEELLTQDNCGNVNPVYWGIMETKEIPAPNGCGDETRYRLYCYDEVFTEEELIEHIKEAYYDSWCDEVKSEWDSILAEELYIYDLLDFIETHVTKVITYEIKHQDVLSSETGCFLTKKAAEEYIRRFGYNHTKPRPYAMTAYRNFELEKLLDIIKNLNLELKCIQK